MVAPASLTFRRAVRRMSAVPTAVMQTAARKRVAAAVAVAAVEAAVVVAAVRIVKAVANAARAISVIRMQRRARERHCRPHAAPNCVRRSSRLWRSRCPRSLPPPPQPPPPLQPRRTLLQSRRKQRENLARTATAPATRTNRFLTACVLKRLFA
jgi:hypothetical protein